MEVRWPFAKYFSFVSGVRIGIPLIGGELVLEARRVYTIKRWRVRPRGETCPYVMRWRVRPRGETYPHAKQWQVHSLDVTCAQALERPIRFFSTQIALL